MEPVMNDHADDNELFKKLIQKPRIAWPTVMLLIAAFTIFCVSIVSYVSGVLPLGLGHADKFHRLIYGLFNRA